MQAFPSDSARSNSEAQQCGQANPGGLRIVGGQKAEENEWPWLVALSCSSPSTFYCTASIINERWIMTAAHCVDGCTRWKAIVGSNRRSFPLDGDSQTLTGDQGITHPQWNPSTLANDIALIHVTRNIQWSGKFERFGEFS